MLQLLPALESSGGLASKAYTQVPSRLVNPNISKSRQNNLLTFLVVFPILQSVASGPFMDVKAVLKYVFYFGMLPDNCAFQFTFGRAGYSTVVIHVLRQVHCAQDCVTKNPDSNNI